MSKPKRFFDLLRNKRLELTNTKFDPDAEQNPFFNKNGKMSLIVALSDEDKDKNGMDDYVRTRRPRQGLDRVSRAHTGPDSGVNASRYDDMVRDIDDLELDDEGHPATIRIGADDTNIGDDDDRSYDRNEFNDEGDVDDFDADAGWAFMRQLNAEAGEDDDDEIDNPDDFDGDSELDGGDSIDNMDDEEDMDGDSGSKRYDGIVRAIKGAYLVSKKRQPDQTFNEVWVFNVGKKYDDDSNIRKAILSGTDIDPTKNYSEDGSQEAIVKTVGNVQYVTLIGIPD